MDTVTDKQLKANQQNALNGGVKTEAGKEVSKYNAVRHGILKKLFNPVELVEAQTIYKRLFEELQPQSYLEEMLVETMTLSYVRRQRVYIADMADLYPVSDEKSTRYLVASERQFYHALHELQRIQAINKGFKPTSMAVDIIGGRD